MYVCICHAVTDSDLDHAIDSGADCVESVGTATGAGTGCGMCHDVIEDVLAAKCVSCPLAALAVA